MASQIQDLDISQVHIIFQRHGQAVSNIVDFESDGVNPQELSMSQLHSLAKGRTGYLQLGIYLPDGLTQFGLDASKTFINDVTQNGAIAPLDNVYMLVSSPLTRAFQTIEGNAPAFNLVGPFNTDSDSHPPKIYLHPGLQEATTWPQDFPALVNPSTKTISYLNLHGGSTAGKKGLLTQETILPTSNLIWPDSGSSSAPGPAFSTFQDPDSRLAASLSTPALPEIESQVREARLWLREKCREVALLHRASGRSGTPKIVVCLHGGIINFVTQKWYCNVVPGSHPSDETVKWIWKGSAKLGNLECVVYRFPSSSSSQGGSTGIESDEAAIEEVPVEEAKEEREFLGKYYRHMSSEKGIRDEDYVRVDGSLVNQKRGHWEFILTKARDVQRFGQERPDVLEALVNWRGVDDFLERYSEGGGKNPEVVAGNGGRDESSGGRRGKGKLRASLGGCVVL
ncbi:hypothetical protein V8F33_014012 [Rhypophila sp. PSN 637]